MRCIFIFTISFLLNLLFLQPTLAQEITDEAERLYKLYGDAVYQVQVIDLTSNKKNSIGSGFQFNAQGMMATNYHVVAEAVQHPESNRVEFLNDKGVKGNLQIITADVIHDIAILKMDQSGKTFISPQAENPSRGSKLFSIGNPHDISFTIIEGIYNGLSQNSFIDKIHFSGSLNQGMSGGPAINHGGEVIGINVSTAGNQLSFLVPAKYLIKLFEDSKNYKADHDFNKKTNYHIQEQLLAEQDKKLSLLLEKEWPNMAFGPVNIPGQIHDAMKCWGGSSHKEKDKFKFFYSMCSSQDRIFLDRNFDTGLIAYRYNYIIGKDDINLLQFYNFYEQHFSIPGGDYKNAGEDNVTNFKCNNSFIDKAAIKWKASFCIRQYKKYPKIFDVHLYMAKLGAEKNGFTTTLMAQGISKEKALALSKKFINEIKGIEP